MVAVGFLPPGDRRTGGAIKNRVTEKLRKRDEINPHSIGVGVSRMGDDIVNIHVGFKIANEDVSYQMDLELDGAEVKLVD